MRNASLRKFVRLTLQKRRLEQALKKVKADLATSEEVVSEQLLKAGVQSVNIDGVTIHSRRELWAGVDYLEGESTDEGYERACDALDAAHLADFVGPRFNVHKLSSYFRERERELEMLPSDPNEMLPPELIGAVKLTEKYRVGARKS